MRTFIQLFAGLLGLLALQCGSTPPDRVVPSEAPVELSTSPSTAAKVTVTLTSIALTPLMTSLPANTTQALVATGTYSNARTKNLTASATWTSSDTAVATVTSAGLVTAISPGTATINAQSGSISGAATITVTTATIVSVAVTPAKRKVAAGASVQFTATATFSDNSTRALDASVVTWASSSNATATVSASGRATTLAVGTTTISATHNASGVAGHAALTVTAATLKSIAVTPTNPSLPVGLAEQFAATGMYSDGSTADLTAQATWSSSSPAVAPISTASGSAGLASALAVGPTTISATFSKKTGATTLTVTPATLVSITITPPIPKLPNGTSLQLTATGIYSDTTTQDVTPLVTWSSSATAVATVSNASGTQGLVVSGSVGTTTISATDPTTGVTSQQVTLAVTPAVLTKIAISAPSLSLAAGTSEQLTATATYTDGTTSDVTESVSWTSTSTTAVAVSNAPGAAGQATAVAIGTSNVDAQDPVTGVLSNVLAMTATPAVLRSISVAPVNPTIPLGLAQTFTATGTYSDGSTVDLTSAATWSSSGAAASISNAGGSNGMATSLAVGLTTITATDPTTSIAGSTQLTVSPKVVTSLAIAPSPATVQAGLMLGLTATATYSDSSTGNVTTSVTWASSTPPLFIVSNAAGTQGQLTGLAVGTGTVSATDPATGVTISANVTVSMPAPPPQWPANASLTVTPQGTPTTVVLSWSGASDPNGVASYAIYENGQLVGSVPGSTLTYTVTGLTPDTQDSFAVQALDPDGAPTSDGPTTEYLVVPPSAASVASPIDRSVATAFATATSFLYSGSTAIQSGVSAGTIVPSTAAVIRGHVYTASGTGIAGVMVTVANHPEFGNTLTQEDGEYDLAVNGGQTLRLHYFLANYLPVDRHVQAPWQDYVTANDVVLIQLDPQVTAIDVSSSFPTMQVARGTSMTDSSGTRRATLMVPPGTEATMTLPDGSTSPLTTMHVRATEYSVGPNGNKALPADLPATAAYSYAVELSADEVLSAGATSLTFSQPLSLYIEDFLSLPVGTSVPTGYYDPSRGAWVASGNGVILKILSVTGGQATIDVTGDGVADTGTVLTALGITTIELQQLASLYSVGQSLWRTPVGHFTPYDDGPGGGPSTNAPDVPTPCTTAQEVISCPETGFGAGCFDQAPGNEFCGAGSNESCGFTGSDCEWHCCPAGNEQGSGDTCVDPTCNSPAPPPPPDPQGPGDCKKNNASTIACQRQSLGEDIALAGTPYTLHYESGRQRGHAAELSIPLSASLAGSPLGIQMQVTVAGRLFTQSFPATNQQTTTFVWDGNDAYGRLLQGGQPINVAITYEYAGVSQNESAFGLNGTGTPIAGSATRLPFPLTKTWSNTLDYWDAEPEGLGGWTLNVHHTYDVTGHVLRLGDGTDRTLRDIPPVVRTFAGTGQAASSGDGGLATSAPVTSPQAVAIGFDGSVYIADGQSCIRRVGTDGVIHTFAGQCNNPGFSGDGGPATSALLQSPQDIAIGADGSVYIADTSNQRVRRVDPAGIIHTVAGSGPTGGTAGSFSGDGGPALAATLNNPTGVDVTSDGTLYVADRDNGRIRQIAPAGTIATVAGSGPSSASTGSEGPAATASLGTPVKVRTGPDGSFYIAESSGNVVRRVGPEGIIHPVAGTGTAGFTADGPARSAMLNAPLDLAFGPGGNLYVVDQSDVVRQIATTGLITNVLGVKGQTSFSGDNGLATAAAIGKSSGLRIGPDGSLYVASTADNRVRLVQSVFAPYSSATNTFQFPSQDGQQLFVFDGTGRHQKTLQALTGATLYAFGYDSAGRLASVTDVDGNVTRFGHDGAGNPTGATTPYGQTWTFIADSNGYLASANDPANETTQFTYNAKGLMQTKTDPRGGLSKYVFDSNGRLTSDQDAAGGGTTLTSAVTVSGTTVTMKSARGIQTTLATSLSLDGNLERSNTLPGGTSASFRQGPTSSTVETADGSLVTTTQIPDPRSGFGMLSPTVSVNTTLPSGLSSTTTTTRAVTLSGNSVASLTEQTTLNGNAWTRVFNAATQTWTTTTPMGRQTTLAVDAAGRPLQVAVPSIAPVSFAYDSHGRLMTTTQGLTTYNDGYDAQGYLASVSDPLGNQISYTNDAVGRPLQTQLQDGRQLSAVYDAAGNLDTLNLPGGAAHLFTYSPVNQVTSYQGPTLGTGSTTTSYGYDLDRDLTTVTRPDAVTVTKGYDPTSGLLKTTAYPQGTLSLAYNAHTGLISSRTAADGEGLSYNYNGMLRTGVTWSGPVAGSLSLGFDNNFRMTSQTVNGTALAFGYDLDGLLTGAGALKLTLDSQNGHLTGTTLGSMTDTYGYDSNGLFANYTAKYNGNALYSESVVRDLDRRITQKTETVQGTTHVWGYTFDAAGRLTDVTEDGNAYSHYGYDADDNRTTYTNSSGTVNPTYDAQDRLLTYGVAAYTYTANGEITSKTVNSQATSYTYDALGNLLQVAPATGSAVAYVVDGDNRRVGKELAGKLNEGFLYRDGLNVVAQLDGSGNLVARFVFGSKPNVPDYFTSSAGTFRILSDHLGSPRLVVNASTGAVVQQIDYDEFGVVTNDTAPGTIPFGFAGGLYDKDTGLVRFGMRDYDASVGRWTAKDPVRFRGGLNFYVYAGDDPINHRDPMGLDPSSCSLFCTEVTGAVCWAVGLGGAILGGPESLGASVPAGLAVSVDCTTATWVACESLCSPDPTPPSPGSPGLCPSPGPAPSPCDPSTTDCGVSPIDFSW